MALNMQTRAVPARHSYSLAGWGRAGAARTRTLVTCMAKQHADGAQKANRKPAGSIALRRPPSMPLQATVDDKELEVANLEGGAVQGKLAIPARYQLLMATGLSFVLCNMDKVNMSVAIIPMAMDNGWSPSVSGTVQAAFFYGYMLSQLPGGYLASTVGGRRVLPSGVALWSAATCAVPLLAGTVPGLCVARAGVGLGEAVAPSAAIDMVSRVVPPAERSRAVAFVFTGLHIGSITGLLAAPALINWLGWQSVFVVFGGAGLVWVAWYESLVRGLCARDPEFAQQLAGGHSHSHAAEASADPAAADGGSSGDHHAGTIDVNMTIPYRAFLRSQPVRALCFTHFCHNWLHYTMMSWLPYYFTSTLSVDLLHAAQTALFPPLAGIVASSTAGPLADGLIARGLPLPTVRKLVQGASFMGPFIFLLAACNDQVQDSRTLTVACITAALGMSSLSLGGMYCTHSDMSPRYASALLGLTNTVGAIPGIMGVATVGYLYDTTHSWDAALFMPSTVCMVAGCLVYSLFARNHPIDFDALDNSPFAFEKYLPRMPSWLSQRLPWNKKQQQQEEETVARDNSKKLD